MQKKEYAHYQESFISLKRDLAFFANSLPEFILRNPQAASLNELPKSKKPETIEAWRTPYVFSHLFILISEVIPETVWLQQIQLKKEGNLIVLKGVSTNEQDLQKFIQQLNRLNTLLSFQLTANHIERIHDEKNKQTAYQFYIEVASDDKQSSVVA